VLGGAGAVSALALGEAPWWVVAVAVVLAIVTPGVVLLAQALLPQESDHRRDLWLAGIRLLDRRFRREQ